MVDVPTCRMCGTEMRGSVCCWSCTSRGRERCLPFGRQLEVRTSCEPGHDVFSFRRARAASCLRSESIIALYCAAPWYRPIDDLGRMRRMFEGSNVVLTAWDGDRLVGVLRGVTDGAYTTYVCDLAVHPDYQRSGIGHELLERVVSTYPESGSSSNPHELLLTTTPISVGRRLKRVAASTPPLAISKGVFPARAIGSSLALPSWSSRLDGRMAGAADDQGLATALPYGSARTGTVSAAPRMCHAVACASSGQFVYDGRWNRKFAHASTSFASPACDWRN